MSVGVQVAPLDVGAAVDAVFSSGVGTVLQFIMVLMVIAMVFGGIFMSGFAVLGHMSTNTKGSMQTADRAIAAGVLLVGALVFAAGPTILSELGFQFMDHIDPVNVFAGGGGGGS